MKCPFCGFSESKVIDSRPTDEGERIRRRRECTSCAKRLFNGLLRACEKRPVSIDTIEKIVDDIELTLQNSLDREVTATRIGELAMDKLKDTDEVAYVRFASVYRQFKDINTFMDELAKLLGEKK